MPNSRAMPVQDLAQALRILARYRAEGAEVRLVSDQALSSQTAPAELERKVDPQQAGEAEGWLMRRRVATLLGTSGSLPPYMLEEAVQDPDSGFGHFIQVLENHLGLKFMRVVAERQGLSTEAGLAARHLRQLAGTDVWDALADGQAGEGISPAGLFVARWQPGGHEAVSKLLVEYFGKSISLTEQVPGMLDVPDSDQARLGGSARLGDHTLGRRVRNDVNRIGIRVACESVAQLRRWMPGGKAWQHLEHVLGVGLGRCFDVQVRLTLPAGSDSDHRLGVCRLGQSAVAGRRRQGIHRVFESRMGIQGA